MEVSPGDPPNAANALGLTKMSAMFDAPPSAIWRINC
jgi:hypothetical protein